LIKRELMFLMAKWRNEVAHYRQQMVVYKLNPKEYYHLKELGDRLEKSIEEIEELLEAHASTQLTINLQKRAK